MMMILLYQDIYKMDLIIISPKKMMSKYSAILVIKSKKEKEKHVHCLV